MIFTIKDIFRANNLRQDLAKNAKLIGSIIPENVRGVRAAKQALVKNKGKLIIKKENLTPFGVTVVFIE